MSVQVQQHVSSSIRQATSALERRWNGLCVASCLALNWPLSLENLGAVKASLLSTYARQSLEALNGGSAGQSEEAWSTFARKVHEVLRRDSGRTLMRTRLSWLNCRQSSLTRLIYSNRRMRQRSRTRSPSGLRRRAMSVWWSSILSVRRHLEEMRTAAKISGWFSPTASSFTDRLARWWSSYTTAVKMRHVVLVDGQGCERPLMPRSRSCETGTTVPPTSPR